MLRRTVPFIASCVWGLSVCAASASAGVASFQYVGTEQTWQVPAGVTKAHVSAIGAPGSVGGTDGACEQALGGQGARVEADIAVTPSATLYVEVGGVPGGSPYGWNGVPDGQTGEGGGASDVRTVARADPLSLGSRLIVAGGGGSGGYCGGAGGSAGTAGSEDPTASCAGVAGVGQPGTQSAGGAGGSGDYPGAAGQLGYGGAGGDGPLARSLAGDGGGGYYGGGGGASAPDAGTEICNSGGGGGSNLVPEGGSAALSSSPTSSITFSWGTGSLRFATDTMSSPESSSATVTVQRVDSSEGAVSVHYATTDGTAAAGADYVATSGTLSFAAGETAKTFSLTVNDDSIDEPDETISLTLSEPTGGASLGAPSTATLTIADDDAPPSQSPSQPQPQPLTPFGADTVAPLIEALTLSPKRFAAARRGGPIVKSRTVGTLVAYRLSEPATVRFVVQRATIGVKRGGRCVKRRRSSPPGRRCIRFEKVRGSFSHAGKAGRNALRFSGRLAGRLLRPGRYRLVAVATDSAGNRSRAANGSFTILASKRRPAVQRSSDGHVLAKTAKDFFGGVEVDLADRRVVLP